MTESPDPPERLRERASRLAERLAGREDTTVVAVLAGAGKPKASRRAISALAGATSGRRRTLLVNLSGPGSGLDRHLDVEGRDGLAGVRAGRRKLSEAAVQPPGRSFLYLPAGDGEADDRPKPTQDPSIQRALERMADKIREAGGLLLLYLDAGGLPAGLGEGLVEGAVLLSEADPPLPEGVPVLGRLTAAGEEEPPVPTDAGEAGPAEDTAAEEPFLPGISDAEAAGLAASGPGPKDASAELAEGRGDPEEPGPPPSDEQTPEAGGADGSGWRRHRRSPGVPWGKIAAGAAAVLVLAGGWWLLADRAVSSGGSGGGAAAEGAGSAAAAVDTSADAAAETDAGGADAGEEEVLASATALPHSVLVASYADWAPARERADRLRQEEGGTWLVAPTPVQGSLYWRLYAGALPDEAAAHQLMGRLVDRGVKDEVREWDVRPASFAYRLDTAAGRAAAEERAAGFRERGVPAYVLPAAAGADTVWQVYAGAYESRGAAGRLGERLEAAGLEAELVTRRGEGGAR